MITDGMDQCERCGRLVQVSEMFFHACRSEATLTPPESVTIGAAVLTLSQFAARARRAADADPARHTAHTATALRCERVGADLSALAIDLTHDS